MNSKSFAQFSYLALSALLCGLMSLPVYAATEAGRILFSRGTVSIVDDNDAARGAGTGSVFYEGDRVVTGSKSIVQLRLSDGALTALRSNSDYQVERQRFDEEEGVYEQAGKLLSGWMRSVTGTIGTRYPDKVSLGTSVATIGIRGTTYQVIHVPEEGLPEFPNLQAGSYVYLEQGQVEISNAAGSRLISPGQVIRVSGPNNQIEVMPALVELFQSQSLLSFQSDRTEGFAVRELTGESDALVDRIGHGDQQGGTVGAFVLASAVGIFGEGEKAPIVPGSLTWAGEGENRYVREMTTYYLDDTDVEYRLTGNVGSQPTQTAYQPIFAENGQITSQLYWGVWEEGTFAAEDVNGQEPYFWGDRNWHYMLASNAFESSAAATGLTGRYRYSYVGGTELDIYLGSNSTPEPGSMTIEEGSLLVNFDTFTIDAQMTLNDGTNQYKLYSDIYDNSIHALYAEGGHGLTSGPGSLNLSGTMSGMFIGQNGEGLMTNLELERPDDDPQSFEAYHYYGTAAFQQEFTETNVAGGVVTFTTSEGFSRDGATDILPIWGVETGGSGSGTFLNSASFVAGPGSSTTIYYEVSATASIVQDQDSATVTGDTDSVEVYWGIWGRNDYQVTRKEVEWRNETSSTETPNNGWHYMIADNVLAAAEVEALGLTGTFTYNYGGGTTLVEGNDGLTATIDSASRIEVDFANLGGQGIAYSLVVNDYGGNDIGFVGTSDLASLYSSTGVGMVDELGGPSTLSISGTFAGNDAQALLTGVEFNDGTVDYHGTALFEKEVVLVVTGGTGQGL